MLRNIWFYFWFLAIFAAIMFFSKSNVFSFRRFPAQLATKNIVIGELHFVQKKNIQDIVLGISYANIAYGAHQGNAPSAAISVTNMDSVLWLIANMERAASVDIAQLLTNASDRERILTTHMKTIHTLIGSASSVAPWLEAFITNVQLEYNACKANKEQADAAYIAWLNDNNASLVAGGYDSAQEQGACETQKRIILNAYGPIATKLSTYLTTLQSQYAFMEQHFDTLVHSYDLFEPGVLEELQSVRDALE